MEDEIKNKKYMDLMKGIAVDEKVCEERHKRVDQRIEWVERDIASIKKQTTATLVFAIVTLVSIVVVVMQNYILSR